MKKIVLIMFSLFLLGGSCVNIVRADLSDVIVSQGNELLNKKDYIKARDTFRKAIKLNPDNIKAWEGYDQTVIEIYKRSRTKNRYIFDPKFEINIKKVKFFEVKRFARKSIFISGTVKNMADVAFSNMRIVLKLFNKKKELVDSRAKYIKNIKPDEVVDFQFTGLVKTFDTYKIEVER